MVFVRIVSNFVDNYRRIENMLIKKGFNDKNTYIKISAQENSRTIEVWIDQEGLESRETLSYATIEELLDLKDEIEKALKAVMGVK